MLNQIVAAIREQIAILKQTQPMDPLSIQPASFALSRALEAADARAFDAPAALCVFLASAASKGISGRLLSAMWDPWRDLPSHAAGLAAGDVYTLRRITARDRGLDWEEAR